LKCRRNEGRREEEGEGGGRGSEEVKKGGREVKK